MSPRNGRPPSLEPKAHRESFRLSDSDIEKINFCIERTGMNKTDVIREGINKVYEEIKRNNR